MIRKERDLYETQIKQLHAEKQQYHQNNQILQYRTKRLHDNREEHQSIFNYDKELFFNLNFLTNVPRNIEQKIEEMSYHFSLYNRAKYGKKDEQNNLEIKNENFRKSQNGKQFSISNYKILFSFSRNFSKL